MSLLLLLPLFRITPLLLFDITTFIISDVSASFHAADIDMPATLFSC